MRRFHDLDALRAFAMLLGVVWHAVVVTHVLFAVDGAAGEGLAWFATATHAFRMPLFFLIAGFFAAMVVARRGETRFTRERLRRIGLPLLVGAATVVPLTDLASGMGPAAVELSVHPRHLWFLEYLLLFYAAALVLRRLGARVPSGVLLRPLPRTAVGVVVGTAALTLGGPIWTPDDSFVPVPGLVAYYGLFFASGWLLWAHRDRIGELGRHGVWFGALALGLGALLVGVQRRAGEAGALDPERLLFAALTALTAWASIAALFALAARFCAVERPRVRYLVDASYWLYLVHLPVLAFVLVALHEGGSPWWLALPTAIAVATAVGLATYGAFVRRTVIGDVLHGPRPEVPGTRKGPRERALLEWS